MNTFLGNLTIAQAIAYVGLLYGGLWVLNCVYDEIHSAVREHFGKPASNCEHDDVFERLEAYGHDSTDTLDEIRDLLREVRDNG